MKIEPSTSVDLINRMKEKKMYNKIVSKRDDFAVVYRKFTSTSGICKEFAIWGSAHLAERGKERTNLENCSVEDFLNICTTLVANEQVFTHINNALFRQQIIIVDERRRVILAVVIDDNLIYCKTILPVKAKLYTSPGELVLYVDKKGNVTKLNTEKAAA